MRPAFRLQALKRRRGARVNHRHVRRRLPPAATGCHRLPVHSAAAHLPVVTPLQTMCVVVYPACWGDDVVQGACSGDDDIRPFAGGSRRRQKPRRPFRTRTGATHHAAPRHAASPTTLRPPHAPAGPPCLGRPHARLLHADARPCGIIVCAAIFFSRCIRLRARA